MYVTLCPFTSRISSPALRTPLLPATLSLNTYLTCIGASPYNESWPPPRENPNPDAPFSRVISITEGPWGALWSFSFRFMVPPLEKSLFFRRSKVECSPFCLARSNGIFSSVGGVLLFAFARFFFLVSSSLVGQASELEVISLLVFLSRRNAIAFACCLGPRARLTTRVTRSGVSLRSFKASAFVSPLKDLPFTDSKMSPFLICPLWAVTLLERIWRT